MTKFGKSLLEADKEMARHYFRHSPFKKVAKAGEKDHKGCRIDSAFKILQVRKNKHHNKLVKGK